VASRDKEILRGVAEASNVLESYPVAERTSFDILGAITGLGIPVLFRPLKGLWGATITVADDIRGILVTSRLPLHLQRFTLAHELGHYRLGHKIQLDPEIGFAGRYGPTSRGTHEIAADTFAAELLGAKRFVLAAAKRHRWTKQQFHAPQVVYQLSLRLGISFEAACWALVANGVLTRAEATSQAKTTVKDLKLELLRGEHLEDSWADVWMITANDSASFIEGGPHDVFAIHLNDYASGGYIWELIDAGQHGRVLRDDTLTPSPLYGEPSSRVVLVTFAEPGVHRLLFAHRRPWNEETVAHIDISVDSYGKEIDGFPRRERQQALAGVAN
jgi:Zn-dependent peptidase ImmA (M78 family)